MVVCFVEPIFSLDHPFLKNFGEGDASVVLDGDMEEPCTYIVSPPKKDSPTDSPTTWGGRVLMEVNSNFVGRALLGMVNYAEMLL